MSSGDVYSQVRGIVEENEGASTEEILKQMPDARPDHLTMLAINRLRDHGEIEDRDGVWRVVR